MRRRKIEEHDKVNIRKTHPNLHRWIMAIAVGSLSLGVSYWFGPAPTFKPYGIDIRLIAVALALLGFWQIIFLLVHHLRMVRIGLAVSVSFMLFWGLSNTQQSFAGKASFTVPILYLTIGTLQVILLLEPPVNPQTRRDNEVKLIVDADYGPEP